jgi:hypothetical protein
MSRVSLCVCVCTALAACSARVGPEGSSAAADTGRAGGRYSGTRYCAGIVSGNLQPGKSEKTQVSVTQGDTQLTVSGVNAGVPGLMCEDLMLIAEASGSSSYFFNEDSCTSTSGTEVTVNPAVPPAYVTSRSIEFAVQMRADNGDSADCTFTLDR